MTQVPLATKLSLAIFLFFNVNAQVHFDWERAFVGAQPFPAVAKDAGENIWIAGGYGAPLAPKDALIIKYNSAGTKLFDVTYNSPANGNDLAKDIAMDASGNAYVAGQAVTGNTADIFLLKYNSAGTLLWQQIFTTTGSTFNKDDVKEIALDASGNIYLAGSVIKSSLSDQDYLIVKYNSAGVLQWSRLYNGLANNVDEVRDMAVDASGNVFVTGRSMGRKTLGGSTFPSQFDYTTLKFNSAGTQQWEARYFGVGLNSDDIAEGLALDPSGNVYVTGTTATSAATIKYNSSGIQLWVQVFAAPSGSGTFGYDIAADASGNAYVCGEIKNSADNYDVLAIKYNTSGAQQWSAQYEARAGAREIMPNGALDGAGNFYLAGSVEIPNTIGGDRLVIKYSSAGVRQWATTVAGFQRENSSDMVVYTPTLMVGQNPVIVVTGGSRTASSVDAYTTKFSQPTDRGSRSVLEPLINGYAIGNLPNPFRSSTNITYELPEAGRVTINVYDVMGRKVSTLVDAARNAGTYVQRFTPRNLSGGVYHYQFTVQSKGTMFTATRSMLLQK